MTTFSTAEHLATFEIDIRDAAKAIHMFQDRRWDNEGIFQDHTNFFVALNEEAACGFEDDLIEWGIEFQKTER